MITDTNQNVTNDQLAQGLTAVLSQQQQQQQTGAPAAASQAAPEGQVPGIDAASLIAKMQQELSTSLQGLVSKAIEPMTKASMAADAAVREAKEATETAKKTTEAAVDATKAAAEAAAAAQEAIKKLDEASKKDPAAAADKPWWKAAGEGILAGATIVNATVLGVHLVRAGKKYYDGRQTEKNEPSVVVLGE